MHTVRRILIAAAIAGALASMLGVSTAHACNPGRSNNWTNGPYGAISSYWNGWFRPINGATVFDDVTAHIDAQNQYAAQVPTPGCSGKTCDFTWAWIMLTNLTLDHWVQIGPATLNDGSRANFVQCDTDNGLSNAFLSPSAAGTTPTYEISDLGGQAGMELTVSNPQHYDFCTNANFVVASAQAAVEQ